MEVPAEDVQARARLDIPHAAGAVVTSANDAAVAHVQASHALLVALERSEQPASLNVPHAHRTVA